MDYSLLKFISSEQESLDFLEKYSILNCLTEDEIEELYFNFDCGDLIFRYLNKYYNKSNRVYKNILLDLIHYFERSQISDRRVIREFFVNIFPFTSKYIQFEIFRMFSESPNLVENRRAVKLSSYLEDDNGYAVAIQLFEKWRDRYMRQDIITYLPSACLVSNLSALWSNDLLNRYRKIIFNKLPENNDFVKFFLSEKDLKMYLLYLLKSNCDLIDIEERYPEIDREERKYIKWVAGEYRQKRLLLKLIEIDKLNDI